MKEWLKKQFTEMTFYAGVSHIVFGILYMNTLMIGIGVGLIAIDDEIGRKAITKIAPFLAAKVDKV